MQAWVKCSRGTWAPSDCSSCISTDCLSVTWPLGGNRWPGGWPCSFQHGYQLPLLTLPSHFRVHSPWLVSTGDQCCLWPGWVGLVQTYCNFPSIIQFYNYSFHCNNLNNNNINSNNILIEHQQQHPVIRYCTTLLKFCQVICQFTVSREKFTAI